MGLNAFKDLMALLPSDPLQVGDVVAVDLGVVTVELPGGGRITARGSASIGQRVFVRGGAIDGDAPDLPFDDIEI
jgi:hypothetical protein